MIPSFGKKVVCKDFEGRVLTGEVYKSSSDINGDAFSARFPGWGAFGYYRKPNTKTWFDVAHDPVEVHYEL